MASIVTSVDHALKSRAQDHDGTRAARSNRGLFRSAFPVCEQELGNPRAVGEQQVFDPPRIYPDRGKGRRHSQTATTAGLLAT